MSEINKREAIKTRSELERKAIAAIPAGQKFLYEPFPVVYNSQREYIPDVVLKNGIVIELKGFLRPEDRRKLREIKAQYPDLDIRLVFENARVKISKDSNTTYEKWAIRNGFIFSGDGVIPVSWYTEKKKLLSIKTLAFFANLKKKRIAEMIDEEIENWWDDLYEEIEAEELEAAEAEKAKAAAEEIEAECEIEP